LPPGLDAAVQKGLAKSPDDRYRSAADMASALAPFGDMRSERVARQLLQRSTLRPGGGSLPPLEIPGAPSTRNAFGVSSVGSPTEKVGAGGTVRSSSPGAPRSPSSNPQRISSSGARASSPGLNLPGPATERVGSPETERVSSAAGANWLTMGIPLDTAAPTTLPAFLRRRQTELKIGLPVLAALILAAVLFKVLQRGGAHSAAEPVEALPVLRVDTTAETGRAPAPTGPASPPAIRAVPGAAPTAAPTAPARAREPAQPTVVPAVPSPATSPGVAVVPSADPPQVRAGARPSASPEGDSRAGQRGAAGKKRRPSLKQIGIDQ
jgi:hypothetical protein